MRAHFDRWTKIRGGNEEISRLSELYIKAILNYTEKIKNVSIWIHGIFEFIDFYQNYSNPDGTLNPALSDNNVHIGKYILQSRREIADLVEKHYKTKLLA